MTSRLLLPCVAACLMAGAARAQDVPPLGAFYLGTGYLAPQHAVGAALFGAAVELDLAHGAFRLEGSVWRSDQVGLREMVRSDKNLSASYTLRLGSAAPLAGRLRPLLGAGIALHRLGIEMSDGGAGQSVIGWYPAIFADAGVGMQLTNSEMLGLELRARAAAVSHAADQFSLRLAMRVRPRADKGGLVRGERQRTTAHSTPVNVRDSAVAPAPATPDLIEPVSIEQLESKLAALLNGLKVLRVVPFAQNRLDVWLPKVAFVQDAGRLERNAAQELSSIARLLAGGRVQRVDVIAFASHEASQDNFASLHAAAVARRLGLALPESMHLGVVNAGSARFLPGEVYVRITR
jgi:hypothetical protein